MRIKGGPGSGNHGHSGRPGHIGGSNSGGSGGRSAGTGNIASTIRDQETIRRILARSEIIDEKQMVKGLVDSGVAQSALFSNFRTVAEMRNAYYSVLEAHQKMIKDFPDIEAFLELYPLKKIEIVGSTTISSVAKSSVGVGGRYYAGVDRMIISRGNKDTTWREQELILGGHNVNYNGPGMYRHEFSHHIDAHAQEVLPEFYSGFSKVAWSLSSNDAKREVSGYAGSNKSELFAESFSAYVHPKYGSGDKLPKQIEDIFVKHFPKAEKKSSTDIITKAKPKLKQKPLSKEQLEFVFRETTTKYEKQFQKTMIEYFKDQEKAALSVLKKGFEDIEQKHLQGRHDQMSHAPGTGGSGPTSDEYFYHGTVDRCALKIMREGIVPNNNRNFADNLYYTGDRKNSVFVSRSLDIAQSYALNLRDKLKLEKGKISVPTVFKIKMNVKDFVEDEEDRSALRKKGTIPPEAIVAFTTNYGDTWKDLTTPKAKAEMNEEEYYVPLVILIEKETQDTPPNKSFNPSNSRQDKLLSETLGLTRVFGIGPGMEEIKGGPGSGNFGHAGRIGEVGGSGSGGGVGSSLVYSKEGKQAIQQALQKTKETGKEISILFGAKGELLGSTEDDKAEGAVDLPFNKDLNTAGANLQSIHTHPNEEPLSYKDIETLAQYDGLRIQAAITPAGNIHVAEKTSSRRDLYQRTNDLYLKLKTDSADEVIAGRITSKEQAARFMIAGTENLLRTLDKEGLIKYNIQKFDLTKSYFPLDSIEEQVLSPSLGLTRIFPRRKKVVQKGGPGSGNFGHGGRPGQRGGSTPGTGNVYRGEWGDVFHGTAEKFVDSILKNGVVPDEKIFASERFDVATFYARNAVDRFKVKKCAVLVLHKDDFPEKYFPDQHSSAELMTEKTIPPERIKRIELYSVSQFSKDKPRPYQIIFPDKEKKAESIDVYSLVFIDEEQKSLDVTITKASPNALPDRFDFSDWAYKDSEWNKRLQEEGGLFIKEVYGEEGKRVWDDLVLRMGGLEGAFDIDNPLVQEFIKEYSYKFAQGINETTVASLQTAMSKGMSEGLGMDGIAKLIRGVFDNCTKYRSLLIARTETIRASNGAAREAYRQSEVVEGMEWLTTADDRRCSFCLAMDGKVVGLDENYFELGDSLTIGSGTEKATMKFDYEAVGYPPLHPACRCTVVPRVYSEYEIPKSIGLNLFFKGGPRSGNHGHSGRPGHVGGSGSGDGRGSGSGEAESPNKGSIEKQTYEPNGIPQKEKERLIKEIENEWQGTLRKGSARNVLYVDSRGYYNLNLVKKDGKLKGAMSWVQSGPTLAVSNFGTKEPGYGKAMMQDLVNKAAELKCGIHLISLPDAVGFYEDFGMRKGSFDRWFVLTKEDCAMRKKELDSVLPDNEPESGCFVYSSEQKQVGLGIFFKGGHGSGIEGHRTIRNAISTLDEKDKLIALERLRAALKPTQVSHRILPLTGKEISDKLDLDKEQIFKLYQKDWDTLSTEQKQSIAAYQYRKTKSIQDVLRKEKKNKEAESIIASIDSALENQTSKADFTLFRGVSKSLAKQIQSMNPGDTIIDKGFMSTSMDISRAIGFAGGSNAVSSTGKGVLIVIQAPKGTKGLMLPPVKVRGAMEFEYEFLLPKGSTLRLKETRNETVNYAWSKDSPPNNIDRTLKIFEVVQ